MKWTDIIRLQSARQAVIKAVRQYDELCVPYITDPTLIPCIVTVCRGMTVVRSYGQFLAVSTLLALYAPQALTGKKISNNLRKTIAQAVGCPSGYVSKTKLKVLFLYIHNPQVRIDLTEAAKRAEAVIKHTQTT